MRNRRRGRGTRGASGAGFSRYDFGAIGHAASAAYLDTGGGHSTTASATLRAFVVDGPRKIARMAVTHIAGTGTAVYRLELRVDAIDTGFFVDIPITENAAIVDFDPPLEVDYPQRLSCTTRIASGSVLSSATNPTVSAITRK